MCVCVSFELDGLIGPFQPNSFYDSVFVISRGDHANTFIIQVATSPFPWFFCFSLIVMSALGHKSVIFGEYGTQRWSEERAVYLNTQQGICSSLTKVMLMPSYLLEITEGLLSTWPQWCLSVSAEHQFAPLCWCITIQFSEPKSSVGLHSTEVSLDPWITIHLWFFTLLGFNFNNWKWEEMNFVLLFLLSVDTPLLNF